jgi:hypothetical protein
MYFHHHRERGLIMAWLNYSTATTGCIRFELCWRTWLTGIWFGYNDEMGWGGSIGVPGFYLAIHANVPKWLQLKVRGELEPRREVSLAVHGGTVSWSLWRNPHHWSSDVPRWRDGHFDVVEFLLGPARYEQTVIDERDILVPMPERSYPAAAKLLQCTWKRPRWFARSMKRVQIDVPDGIPFPGKGESSWNCGDDATYSISTGKCNSIPEGVGIMVGTCLASRVKNGGWDDYVWTRQPENSQARNGAAAPPLAAPGSPQP